jgi:predicted acyl esterase
LLTLSLLGVLALPSSAAGAGPLGLEDCGMAEGVRQCSGLVRTWDGVPLDTTVTLPPGESRSLPLVVEIHGFGNSKYEYLDPASTAYTDNAFAWARDGYAVLTYTARGLWGSCGTPEARAANPADCAKGYIHLADVRYEVRDTQELVGRLVDEGVADPRRLGVTGDSYGGGQSLMLAALRDRVMLPDGSLVPWRSPSGRRLHIAAAAPVIPWTDLITAAAPNGRVSATAITDIRRATAPVGVEKATFVNAIFAAAQFAVGPGQPVGEPFVPGRPMGYLAPGGTDPEADVAGWVARTDRGEPYDDASAQAIVQLLTRYHSAYYIPPGTRGPPPLLLSAGFTDDLFPVDESLRFANRTRKRFPKVPVSVLLGDFGHQRAANKKRERDRLLRVIHRWFDHYLRGDAHQPQRGVTAFVQTCPRDAAPLGPRHARSFAGLAHGRLRLRSPDPQTVTSDGGDPATGAAIDPAAGGGDSCVAVPADRAPGTAVYRRTVRRRALTLIGQPKVTATVAVSGTDPTDSQIASRLWDVAPDGQTRQLVARGLYRPRAASRQRWLLHPGAWKFKPGHTIELELLGNDAPYARPSNDRFETTVSGLELRLPLLRAR